MNSPSFLLAHWHLWLVGAVIAAIVLTCLQRFVRPALQLRHTLNTAIARLEDLQSQDSVAAKAELERDGAMGGVLAPLWTRYARSLQLATAAPDDAALGAARANANRLSRVFFSGSHAASGSERLDLAAVERLIEHDADMARLWDEFNQALEVLGRLESGSQSVARAWQATSPAEHFFDAQWVVDSPLRTDFFRHVPGILTGVGIIGTFVGLILGLMHFDVRDPEQVQMQLSALVQTVGQAFQVSAVAIALAMVFTWVEKALLSARYRQTEQLQHLLDSLFWPRGGTEQIERLTQAAEMQTALSFKLLAELRQQRKA